MTGTITPIGVNTAIIYSSQAALGQGIDWFVDPGDVNLPIIFEPPAGLTGDALQVWLVATGGASWGGCQVWISLDDATYTYAGIVYRGARQGVLTATLPSHADPDAVDTLSVDLTESQGQLLSGTAADANSFVTLCYCGGELVSYQDATLTSAYNYDLETLLRRGCYGTSITSHAINSQFARVGPTDAAIFKYTYPDSYVGKTIYIKLLSFNLFGLEVQDIADVTAVTYVLTGGGRITPPFIVYGSQSGPTISGDIVGSFIFNSTIVFANNFGSSRVCAEVAATASTVYTLRKNGVAVGTITFAPAGTIGTFVSSNVNTVFNQGEELTITAPVSPDATLDSLAWSISGLQGLRAEVAEAHGSQTGPIPSGSVVLGRWIASNPIETRFGSSTAGVQVAPTVDTAFTFYLDGLAVCAMMFAAGMQNPTYTFAGDVTINPGSVLSLKGPVVTDATLAGLTWSVNAVNLLISPATLVHGSVSGSLASNGEVQHTVFSRTMVLPVGLTGAYGHADTPGVGATIFTIKANGVDVGTMTFGAGANDASFALASSVAFNAGDVLTIVAPASPDGSLADLVWVLAGTS